MMTVGELRAALVGVPDSEQVVIYDQHGQWVDDAYSAYHDDRREGVEPNFTIITQN